MFYQAPFRLKSAGRRNAHDTTGAVATDIAAADVRQQILRLECDAGLRDLEIVGTLRGE